MKSMWCAVSPVALASAIVMSAGPALAQSAAAELQGVEPKQAAAPGDSSAETALGEVVVTARRRAERLQDVPVAVTAVSGAALKEQNIVQVQQLQRTVPGLTIQSSAFGGNVLQVAIRGQRQFDPYLTKDPAVAVYFAEVVQNRPQGLNSGLFDLDSVQVLKGPQGTLFGRNTTGGAMIITPAAPTREFEGYVTAGYGNYDALRLEGAVNLPLNEWAQARFAGAFTRRDGFTRNVTTGQRLDDEHKDNWRFSLRLTLLDGFENWTVISGFDAVENGVGYKLTDVIPGIGFGSAPNVVAELQRSNALPFHSTTSDMFMHTSVRTLSVSNVTEYKLGRGATLKNILGYRSVTSHIPFDLDGSSLTSVDAVGRRVPFFPSREDMNENQYSDELQLLGSAFGNSLDYIVGGYYFLERGRDRQTSGGQGGVTTGGVYQGDRVTIADPIKNESYSVFAQVTYRVPYIEGLSLTLGGRNNEDRRELTSENQISNGACRLTNPAGALLRPCESSLKKAFSRFTYTFSADYKVTPDVLLYFAHRAGYRSGGFNISATSPVQFTPFRPEDVKDYEIGLKSTFRVADGSGRLNLAGYSQDYSNIQRNQGSLINGIFTQTIVNAASAKIKGFEAELALNPWRFLDVGVNLAHIDAHYSTWVSNGADISGSQFAGTPEWTASASIGLHYDLEELGELGVRANIYHQTKTNISDNNFLVAQGRVSPSSVIKPYSLVSGRIELRNVGGSAATVSLWGDNLLDETYYAGGTDLAGTGLGYTAKFLGAPRTYGVEVNYKF